MATASDNVDAAAYTATETLRDGRRVIIRAIRPDDRVALQAAVAQTSPESRFRRFFSYRKDFSEREVAYFVDVDFVRHVALVAVLDPDSAAEIVGGARYIRDDAGSAEMAFTVIDPVQGQGLGSALLRHLAGLARAAGLRRLTAEVLPENRAMLAVFKHSGFPVAVTTTPDAVHVALDVGAPAAT